MIPPIVIAISILMYYAIIIPYVTSALLGMRVSHLRVQRVKVPPRPGVPAP